MGMIKAIYGEMIDEMIERAENILEAKKRSGRKNVYFWEIISGLKEFYTFDELMIYYHELEEYFCNED